MRFYLIGAVLAVVIAGGAFVALAPATPKAYDTPGIGPLTAELVAKSGHRVLPDMLTTVYDAFGATTEDGIYDGLAQVASGDALEALYLERVGAMAGGGLDGADQTLHELRLDTVTSQHGVDTVTMDARWAVIGTVGHAEHMHVRGNSYAAELILTPVDGAWRITGFDLKDVDRSDAGVMFAADDE